MKHKSVLINEVIKALNLKKDGIYVDATLGAGGHTSAIAKLVPDGQIICFDRDKSAIEFAQKHLNGYPNIIFINDTFINLEKHLQKLKIVQIDGIVYDLGPSYDQLVSSERGFTYHGENLLLDMRMDKKQSLTAIDVLNNYSLEELARIFRDYGDEQKAWKLANEIVNYRKIEVIKTNTQLNELIRKVKKFDKLKHPSKNIYQAIRIEVNDEMANIEQSLISAFEFLKPKGRILVITFHSLEDRIVKNIFWEKKQEKIITTFYQQNLYQTLKVIYPSKTEIEQNKSAKSAKLRIIQRNV